MQRFLEYTLAVIMGGCKRGEEVNPSPKDQG